jgi:DNA polymerase-3 subunit gamma/tau
LIPEGAPQRLRAPFPQPVYGKPATSKTIAAQEPRLTIEVEKGAAQTETATANAAFAAASQQNLSTGTAGNAPSATSSQQQSYAGTGAAQPANAASQQNPSAGTGAAYTPSQYTTPAQPAASATGTHAPSQPATTAASGNGAARPKLTGLAAMKEALAAKQQQAPAVSANHIPLTAGAISVYWDEFIDRFRQANKMTVVSNLQLAQTAMLGPEEICIVSRNIVQYRFMEEEKLEISEFFKQKFRNNALILTLQLDESQQQTADTGPAPLSSREQFARMAEKYPLVKELKDRLNMELDF